MLKRQTEFYTPEEYLALEEKADHRSEYYNGEIYAMAGGSYNHNRIVSNANAVLNFALETRPCDVFSSDMRLLVKESGLYTYPDVMVICGDLEFHNDRSDTLTNPTVIIEVLSKTTRDYDRGSTFELYRAIETFRDYVLIEQDRIHLEYFHKLDDGRWILAEFKTSKETLTIESINVQIPIARLYHKVDWFAG